MIKVDWRVAFIFYIQEHKLPPGVDPKSVEATRILRRSKGYVLVGGNLYKRGLASGILMECVSTEEGKEILQEIHEGVCGNHTDSHILVGKAFRSGFYWPTDLANAEAHIRRCTNCRFFGKQPHVPAHNLITIPPSWPFACWGLDMIGLNNRARNFHSRVGGHRQVYQVDRVQANRNALGELSGYFYL
jgi:hypothetical protein